MKKLNCLLMGLLLTISPALLANEEGIAEAKKMFEVIGMEEALQQSMEQMLQVELQQNPALMPYKHVMLAFLAKYMGYESVKEEMAVVYANAFTVEELKQLNAFYETPVGMKTIELMPTLMAEGAQIGTQRVQQNLGELNEMIAAEAARIQQLQQQEE